MEFSFFNTSDEQLIQRALNGSQGSWEKLVHRHEGLVYNYCLRITRNRNDAMDLMQEVFLSVYRNLPSYQGRDRFKAWMMRIAVNKTMDLLRRRKRSPQLATDEFADEALLQWPAPEAHDPERIWEESDTNAHVRQLLQRLPPEQRIVVELKFFQHFTFEEISYQTGVPVNTVKSRLYSSLAKLKDYVEERHVM